MTAPATVAVRHNFETAHRLPFLGGKCTNLHGHSWNVEVTVAGYPDDDGVLIEFATLKRELREWIDRELDHGAMLGAADQLVPVLRGVGSKVFVFDPADRDGLCAGRMALLNSRRPLPWPTVENVAELLRRVTLGILNGLDDDPARYAVHVHVTETAVNAATAGALTGAVR